MHFRRTKWLGAAFLAISLTGIGCGKTQTAHAAGSAPNKQEPVGGEPVRLVRKPDAAPAFQVSDLTGQLVSLADAKGKIVLLNFWATWCGPCRAEIPDLIDLQKRYADRLEIIALATEEDDADQVRRFVQHSGINYRVAMAPDDVVRNYGGIAALPTSFVIDAQGRIVQKHVGLNDPTLYERELRVMLGQAPEIKVEYFDDNGQIFLKNAEKATELPGVDFSSLSAQQKSVALRRMNATSCDCGCQLTLAQCRINDTGCQVSLALANKILKQVALGGKASVKSSPSAPKSDSSGEPQK